MLLGILKKDLRRKKGINITLFIFILLAAVLIASGLNMLMQSFAALHEFITKSDAPHLVQMHAGELNEQEIEDFAKSQPHVLQHQIAEMLPINHAQLYSGNRLFTEKNSVMDHYFVKQNHAFDFLLNLDNQVIELSQGEVAVPIYYMQLKGLSIGDQLSIVHPELVLELTIADFVRDVQMNPSIIHSKRFVIHEADFNHLKAYHKEIEYLIEFKLADIGQLSEVHNVYQSQALPKKGPTIDYNLFKILNMITDGIIAAVIVMVSLLLCVIAILCIRYTMLAALEEDYPELGVMKAIGIKPRTIRSLYLAKYIGLTVMASAVGYAVSLYLQPLFTANVLLYLGAAPKNVLSTIVPLLGIVFIGLLIVLSCHLTLRRFDRISAMDALRAGQLGEVRKVHSAFSLKKRKYMNMHIYLGIREVLGRLKTVRLLLIVFMLCVSMILVPIHLLNTMQSSEFIQYLGVERSDIRIDLQPSDQLDTDYSKLIEYLDQDRDIQQYAPRITSQYKVVGSDGLLETLNVQSGDYSIFDLAYLKGAAPIRNNEIALSYLNSKELDKRVGDSLKLVIAGQEKELIVSGIYQDVTNGGRTAKASLGVKPDTALWYEISLNVKEHIRVDEKIAEYAALFPSARVTDLAGYLAQTLGNTITQLKKITLASIAIALCVAVLITALFMQLAVAQDKAQNAMLRSIGLSMRQLQIQYVTRSLLILGIGLLLGTVLSNTLGPRIVSALFSFMGAAEMKFVIDPIQAYVLCPLLLAAAVIGATILSIGSMKTSNIVRTIVE